MDIDKNNLINVYGIDDNNFEEYLNKFSTLKKVFNLGTVDHLPVAKVRELYNTFLYYFSLGHDMDTIVDETTPIIKRLFFFNGEGYLRYEISEDEKIKNNYTTVDICGRICLLRIEFTTAQEITINDCLFKTIPSPTMRLCTIIHTKTENKIVRVTDDGLSLYSGTIPANTLVFGTIVYPIKK